MTLMVRRPIFISFWSRNWGQLDNQNFEFDSRLRPSKNLKAILKLVAIRFRSPVLILLRHSEKVAFAFCPEALGLWSRLWTMSRHATSALTFGPGSPITGVWLGTGTPFSLFKLQNKNIRPWTISVWDLQYYESVFKRVRGFCGLRRRDDHKKRAFSSPGESKHNSKIRTTKQRTPGKNHPVEPYIWL